MKLALSFGFAVLLVLAGSPRSLWSDKTDKIAASAQDASTLAFAEAMEDWNDDRLIGSFALASTVTSTHPPLIASRIISRTCEKIYSIKDNSKIYKLNSSFLI
jgi:hypothetical protein